jgi:hypothetical protein
MARSRETTKNWQGLIFGGFHGSDGRAWMLGWSEIPVTPGWSATGRAHRRSPSTTTSAEGRDPGASPLSLALLGENVQMLRQTIKQLSPEYREVIFLRELEELSYKGNLPCHRYTGRNRYVPVGARSRTTSAALDRAL